MPILDKKELKHIKIPTMNLKKTMKFFIDLGFETTLRTFNKEANEQIVFLQFKDIIIETNETLDTKTKFRKIDNISINIVDIEKTLKKCKRFGYDIIEDGIQTLSIDGNEIMYFTLKGPSEEKIEFYQTL